MSSGPSGIGQHSTPQTSSLLIGKALFWSREKSQVGAPLASALPRVNAPGFLPLGISEELPVPGQSQGPQRPDNSY